MSYVSDANIHFKHSSCVESLFYHDSHRTVIHIGYNSLPYYLMVHWFYPLFSIIELCSPAQLPKHCVLSLEVPRHLVVIGGNTDKSEQWREKHTDLWEIIPVFYYKYVMFQIHSHCSKKYLYWEKIILILIKILHFVCFSNHKGQYIQVKKVDVAVCIKTSIQLTTCESVYNWVKLHPLWKYYTAFTCY